MADNRMYIRCPRCSKGVYLAKHFGCGWHGSPHPSIGARFEQFISDHFSCHVGGEHLPELKFEHAESAQDEMVFDEVPLENTDG